MEEQEIAKLKRHYASPVNETGWSSACFTCGHIAVGYDTGDLAEEAMLVLCEQERHRRRSDLRERLRALGL